MSILSYKELDIIKERYYCNIMQSIENSTYKGDTLRTSAMNIPIKHPIP